MKLLSVAFFSKNRARVAIQKRHLQGRSTKTEGSRAKKRLSVVFFSKNRARIRIQKRHLEGRSTKTEGSRAKNDYQSHSSAKIVLEYVFKKAT